MLPTLPQSSNKKSPIVDKSPLTFNFAHVNSIKETGECIDI